ncbi:MAG: NAD(P)H-dependent oxidoreductase [Bacteroidota bacterium]
MKNVLVLFAHPRFEQSRANKALVKSISAMPEVTFHDLYEQYPYFQIDVEREKELLLQHDIIVWHHPFYWYSCPPLLKQWIDMVLEFGWAYGPGGNELKGKMCLQVITTGGSEAVYRSEGKNVYSINQFLRPFEQTARLCGMRYISPYAVMGTHKLTEEQLAMHAEQYREIIYNLREEIPVSEVKGCVFQNDIPEIKKLAR